MDPSSKKSNHQQTRISNCLPAIQPKLVIGSSNDRFEKEADRIAQEVLQRPLSHSTVGQSPTNPNGKPETEVSPEFYSEVNNLHGQGNPLSSSVGNFFESRFGQDLSGVRIHADDRAAKLAESINAKAFTYSNNVFFGSGRYSPHSSSGKKLLAHELVHVMQQSNTNTNRVSNVPANRIQRQVEENKSIPAGNNYEFSWEIPSSKNERVSGKISFSLSKPQTSPGVTKKGNAKLQLGETKAAATKKSGKDVAYSLGAALGKMDLSLGEILPGIKISTSFKALETKMNLDKELDFDVDAFTVAVNISGELTEQIGSTALGRRLLKSQLGQRIIEGFKVKVKGEVKVKVDPADVVRLVRLAKMARAKARNIRAAVKADRKLSSLRKENKRIKRHLRKRGDKLKSSKKSSLKARAKRNAKKIKALQRKIRTNRKATSALARSYKSTLSKLKSKSGRLLGGAIKKIGGKILAKLIPGVNIVSTALDLFEIARGIWRLLTGKSKFGTYGQGKANNSSSTGDDLILGPEISINDDLSYEPKSDVPEHGSINKKPENNTGGKKKGETEKTPEKETGVPTSSAQESLFSGETSGVIPGTWVMVENPSLEHRKYSTPNVDLVALKDEKPLKRIQNVRTKVIKRTFTPRGARNLNEANGLVIHYEIVDQSPTKGKQGVKFTPEIPDGVLPVHRIIQGTVFTKSKSD